MSFRRGNIGRQKKRAGVRGALPLFLLAIWIPGVIVAAHLIERSWSLDAAELRTSPQEGDTTEIRQQADTTESRQQAKPKAKRRRPRAAPPVATLNVVPTDPTFVCVDTGPGTEVVFAGTLESPRRFRARGRVRLNMGKTSARLTANGKPVELEPSPEPVGYEITPTRVQELELGQRPCA